MKICLVSQEYPPETAKGGIGTQTHAKAHGLAALGHDVHVVSRSVTGAGSASKQGRINVLRITAPSQRMPIHTEIADWVTYSAAVAEEVAALHAREGLDIVDFPEWACEGFAFLLNRSEWNHLPAVIQLHGPLVMLANTVGWPDKASEFYRTGTAMEGACLRLADAVYSSSRCSAEWCADHYGLDVAAVPTIHTGVDTGMFCPRNVPKAERPTIVFVGKIAPNKGIFELLDAVCMLAAEFPGVQLRVLGRGDEPMIERLRHKAAVAGCADALDLVGFVFREELPDHLSRAHIFAAPSVYEGGPGFVYLEAMACGLPVIACAGSGAAEVVIQNHNGLLVAPGDPEGLAAALRRLLGDECERRAIGHRAVEFVRENADSRSCMRRLEAFYERTVRVERAAGGHHR